MDTWPHLFVCCYMYFGSSLLAIYYAGNRGFGVADYSVDKVGYCLVPRPEVIGFTLDGRSLFV